MQRRRSARLGVTIGVALGAVVAFATLGGTGLAGGLAKPAKPQSGLGQYQYGAKVTICHKDKVTIRISINALKAHQRQHGDTIGPCAAARAAKAAKLKAAKVKAAKVKAAKAAKQVGATGDTGTGAVSSVSSGPASSKSAKSHKPDKAKAGGAPASTVATPAAPGNSNGNGNGKAKGHDKG